MRIALTVLTGILGLSACAGTIAPDDGIEDLTDADLNRVLWRALLDARLVGPEAWQVQSYPGLAPHGPLLQRLEGQLTVNGHTGPVIVKRHYAGPGVGQDGIAEFPGRYLQAIAVMYRIPGHDPRHGDWFWARYEADGSPEAIDPARCIACHQSAPGGDWVFSHDRYAR